MDGGAVKFLTKCRMITVASLLPRVRNPRRHPPEKIRGLADMILRFGWTVPIVIDDDGGILGGHARLEAAKLLGLERVPVIVAKDLTEQQRRAYVIADNRIAEASGWDENLLTEELRALEDAGEIESALFSLEDLRALEQGMGVPAVGLGPDPGPGVAVGAPEGYGAPGDERARGRGDGTPLVQYSLMFEEEEQQHIFFDFLRFLKRRNAPGATDVARLVEHCQRVMEAAGE